MVSSLEAPVSVYEGIAANMILLQFTVTPADVETKLTRVKFDLARHWQFRVWKATTDDSTPTIVADIPWPDLWEDPNDDPDDTDESNKVNANGRMYVVDAPSLKANDPPTLTNRLWAKSNFEEFARVSFNGQRPSGNDIQGSIVSPRYAWHSEVAIIWDAALDEWRRTTAAEGGNNTLGPGNVPIGKAP